MLNRLKGLLARTAGLRRAAPQPPPVSALHHKLREDLRGAGDDPALFEGLVAELEHQHPVLNRRQALEWLLERHPKPHWVNYLLCMDEFAEGRDEVSSFPANVFMDVSSICSVECKFCKYTHDQLPKKNLTLEYIKSIEWFPYVRLLNMTAGTAEAITNPQFVEIFDHIRTTAPHLHMTLLSNGRTLNERIQKSIAGRLDALHVSMNASCRESYDEIIARGSWDQFSKHMAMMRQTFKGADRPKVTASFVMMKMNSHRAVRHLEFAVEHGASSVLFHHYYPHYIADIHGEDPDALKAKFAPDQSLYLHPQLSDDTFARVAERAKELGVQVHIPPPFNGPKPNIYWGARSYDKPPTDCAYPWTSLYLLWSFKSKKEDVTICCGLASDLGVSYDRNEIATKAGFMKLRNADVLKAYRASANGPKMNPICAQCRESDRFAPDARYPDQREFYKHNGLPIPAHFERQPRALKVITS
jgi:MoaA/NifB/PqqE/SkfB family radical SAM enzyme